MSLPEQTPDVPTPSVLRDAVEMELDALDAPEQTEHGWKVEDRTQADWVGRLRARRLDELTAVRHRAEKQRAAVMAAIKQYLDPIDQWEQDRATVLQNEVDRLDALLVGYHRHEVESAEVDPPLTIKLPHVDLCSRKAPDRWEFTDEFVAWATEHRSDLLRLEVDKPKAKKAVTLRDITGASVPTVLVDDVEPTTGELHDVIVPVPGVTATRGERSYWVAAK